MSLQVDRRYVFKKARREQADALFSLYREVIDAGRRNGTTHWSDDYPTREFLDEDIALQRIFVLEEVTIDNAAIVASVVLLETDDLDEEPLDWQTLRSCAPVRLCVAPQYQGRGIGRLVMQYLIAHAKEQGYQSMRLLAEVNGVAANHLYQRLGFTRLGAVALYGKTFNAYELVF
ncbi:MAG: GNAT family N-acetyltransferase [Anaerolineae bacterium]